MKTGKDFKANQKQMPVKGDAKKGKKKANSFMAAMMPKVIGDKRC